MSFKNEIRTDLTMKDFRHKKSVSKRYSANLIDSFYRIYKSYYPEVLLKYSKYIVTR